MFENIRRKSTGGKISVFFWGGDKNSENMSEKTTKKRIKRVNFTNQLIFVDDP